MIDMIVCQLYECLCPSLTMNDRRCELRFCAPLSPAPGETVLLCPHTYATDQGRKEQKGEHVSWCDLCWSVESTHLYRPTYWPCMVPANRMTTSEEASNRTNMEHRPSIRTVKNVSLWKAECVKDYSSLTTLQFGKLYIHVE